VNSTETLRTAFDYDFAGLLTARGEQTCYANYSTAAIKTIAAFQKLIAFSLNSTQANEEDFLSYCSNQYCQ